MQLDASGLHAIVVGFVAVAKPIHSECRHSY